MRKLGPLALPVSPDGPARRACGSSMCSSNGTEPGIGRALMDWALDEARRRRASELFLTVYTDNHRARRYTSATASKRSALMRSWSANRPTRTSSCGCACERRGHPRRGARRPPARLPRQARRGFGRHARRAQRRHRQRRRVGRHRREPAPRGRGGAAGSAAGDGVPGALGRRGPTSNARGRTTTARAPTRWPPTGRASCSESSPPIARRCCWPTPRPAWSAPRTPAGAARWPASPTRRSRRWRRSAPRRERIAAAVGPVHRPGELRGGRRSFATASSTPMPANAALLRRARREAALRPRRPMSSPGCSAAGIGASRGARPRHLCRSRPLLQLSPRDPPRRARLRPPDQPDRPRAARPPALRLSRGLQEKPCPTRMN